MESFESWHAKIKELSDRGGKEPLMFLSFKPTSESDARAAGFELIGTAWDADGVAAMIYKPATGKAPVYICLTCNRTSKLDMGMYCCGRKRIRSS